MKQKIQTLISRGRTAEALRLITPFNQEEGIVLQGRLTEIIKRKRTGQINSSTYSQEKAKINSAILSILNDIDFIEKGAQYDQSYFDKKLQIQGQKKDEVSINRIRSPFIWDHFLTLSVLIFFALKTFTYYIPLSHSLGSPFINGRKSGFSFERIQGGAFTMGQPDPNIGGLGLSKNECPHEVTVKSFRIGKYEVTQADWEEFMDKNPSLNPNCKECPVENVSRSDISAFIEKASIKYGIKFRLPTEEEWEYAAREGGQSTDFKYAGSNNLSSVGWYVTISNKKPHPVGKKTPNGFGLFDMSGNVWEWCEYRANDQPACYIFADIKTALVFRGGSWDSGKDRCRVTARGVRFDSTYKNSKTGFRLAHD